MLNPADINPLSLPSVPLDERSQLPAIPGIYFAIDSQGAIQYIGQSKNVRNRWTTHNHYKHLSECGGIRVSYLAIDDLDLLRVIETALIEYFDPPLNKPLGNPDPVQTPEFLAKKIPKHEKYELASKPYCVKLPTEVDKWLRSVEGGSEMARQALIALWENRQQ